MTSEQKGKVPAVTPEQQIFSLLNSVKSVSIVAAVDIRTRISAIRMAILMPVQGRGLFPLRSDYVYASLTTKTQCIIDNCWFLTHPSPARHAHPMGVRASQFFDSVLAGVQSEMSRCELLTGLMLQLCRALRWNKPQRPSLTARGQRLKCRSVVWTMACFNPDSYEHYCISICSTCIAGPTTTARRPSDLRFRKQSKAQ